MSQQKDPPSHSLQKPDELFGKPLGVDFGARAVGDGSPDVRRELSVRIGAVKLAWFAGVKKQDQIIHNVISDDQVVVERVPVEFEEVLAKHSARILERRTYWDPGVEFDTIEATTEPKALEANCNIERAPRK